MHRSPVNRSAETRRPQSGKLLAVYNTGANYRLVPAAFGTGDTVKELLNELVLAHDTAMLFVHRDRQSESGIPSGGVMTVRSRDKMSRNVEGKVAVMALGTYDPTYAVLNAQRLGAKAFIFIHPSDNLDSVRLKGGLYADSIRIPVYSVRSTTGARISMMLPSHVGIRVSTEKADDDQEATDSRNGVPRYVSATVDTLWASMSLTPNPANQSASLRYDFSGATDLLVEVRNASGQVVFSKPLVEEYSGALVLPTSEWVSGVYLVGVSRGGEWSYRKLVVGR